MAHNNQVNKGCSYAAPITTSVMCTTKELL